MKKTLRGMMIAVVSLLLIVVFVYLGYGWWSNWMGFAGKNLWDWLNLLGVFAIPVAVGLGTVWYTNRQTKVSEGAAEKSRKTELEIAEQRHKLELEIATDNQREAALQTYIDKMSELVLGKKLGHQEAEQGVSDIARVRTLTVLRRLDPERKGSVLQFLYEAGLICKGEYIINLCGADLSHVELNKFGTDGTGAGIVYLKNIDLNGADLSYANLSGVDLSEANLYNANLRDANLSGSFLWGANLRFANLHHANLRDADLIGDWSVDKAADLRNADLSEADLRGICLEEVNVNDPVYASLDEAINAFTFTSDYNMIVDSVLKKAKSLKGAILPDEIGPVDTSHKVPLTELELS